MPTKEICLVNLILFTWQIEFFTKVPGIKNLTDFVVIIFRVSGRPPIMKFVDTHNDVCT